MARPFQFQSLDGAASAGSGSPTGTKGHNSIALAVIAHNLSQTDDTLEIQLEVGVEGVDGAFVPIRDETGTKVGAVNDDDHFEDLGDGRYMTFVYVHGVAAPRVRANITSFTDGLNDDLAVDAYIIGTNRSSSGQDFTIPP